MAAETVRDVVIKIRLAQLDAALKVPSTKELTEALAGYKKEAASTSKAVAGSFDKAGDAVADNVAEVERLNKTMEEAKRKAADAATTMIDTSLRAGEGFKAAGEGAFTLARGIAFVSTTTDEEFSKVIVKIAKVQGAFDLFKGTTETIKGVIEGARAMRIVLAGVSITNVSVAVTNTTVATTNTAVAVTGAAAATSMTALTVALGPIAIGLAAVGAAFFFFKNAEEDIDDTADAIGRATTRLEQFKNLADRRLQQQSSGFELKVEIRRLELMKSQADVSTKISSNSQLQHESLKDLLATAERLSGLPNLQAFLEGQGFKVDLQGIEFLADSTRIGERRLSLEAALTTHKKQTLELERNSLKLLEDEGTQLNRNADIRRRELETAKTLLDKEKERLGTLEETFGRLDPAKQVALRQLTRRIGQGEQLSRAELGTLESLGGAAAQPFVSKEFRAERFSAGALEAFQPIIDRPLVGGGSLETERTRKSDQIEAQLDQLIAQIENQTSSRLEKFQVLIDAVEQVALNTDLIEAIETRLRHRDIVNRGQ